MKLSILAFGITKEYLGSREVSIETDLQESASVGDLRQFLYNKYPDLKRLNSLGIAQGNQYTSDEDLLDPAKEIALIPPVSGG